MIEYHIVIDNSVLEEYNKYYFSIHKKAKKPPIERPIHPSINQWFIMQRPQMNALKQKWKDFGVWLIKKLGYDNLKLDKFEMECISYMPTKRRVDPDNLTPKFLNDSFTESGFIVDDDGNHMKGLTLRTDYDKENPRTEIFVRVIEEKEN